MTKKINIDEIRRKISQEKQYATQLERLKSGGKDTDCIEETVRDAMTNLPRAASNSLVIYGEPQSGKTEMMICLTAKLLDGGHKIVVHLLNDSVDLLGQNLERFKEAALAPTPKVAVSVDSVAVQQRAILFCKKNAHDLKKAIKLLNGLERVVIDDEADFATPNGKVNKKQQTTINKLVQDLIGKNGKYIGVTATPARLNLNNTFGNKTETWVRFRPHSEYTGQDHFFPLSGEHRYRLREVSGAKPDVTTRRALARYLATVAYLNTKALKDGLRETNYTFLVHTSGRKSAHSEDKKRIEVLMTALTSGADSNFIETINEESEALYPGSDAGSIVRYVLANSSRSEIIVLNSNRDRNAGGAAAKPACPFTIVIGGNIVSRGVTFSNLLAMYFTRDVASKLQQDTYIQRARMFGARGSYLEHFELTIPKKLYQDWHRCFVFHRLALAAIEKNKESPVWIGDPRISVASSSSIDRQTVDFDKGEMSFGLFDLSERDLERCNKIVEENPVDSGTLRKISGVVKGGLPAFLIDYIESALKIAPGTLAIHTASSIEKYQNREGTDVASITRKRGFMGKSQMEEKRFPNAIHHVKIFFNDKRKGRVFYKNTGRIQLLKNTV